MGAGKDELRRWAQEEDCRAYCFRDEAASLHADWQERIAKAKQAREDSINGRFNRRRMALTKSEGTAP